ncbi:MAG: protein kinase [Gammaproteobacteria bacterium]|nr:protein kinase [Gammaproteobacteria bacterium]
MTEDANLGERFLRDLVRAAARDVAGFLVPGSATGAFLLERGAVICAQAAWDCLQKKKAPQQRQMMDAVTHIGAGRSREIAEDEVGCYNFPAVVKQQLVKYFSVIPMTARRAICRPNDGGNPATLLSQLPHNHHDLVRFMPLRPPRFEPGDQLAGHDYRLKVLIGQGGFAEVWKAEHIVQETQPAVAIKFCLDPALLVSLKTEIKVYDVLKAHPYPEYLVRLLSTGYSADPPFIVYEYVEGGDLAAWVAGFDGERPSIKNVMRILKMTARALAYAHKNGIVHRDLKPANLLVTRDGRIKVADFGIGAILSAAENKHTGRGGVTGASLLHAAYTPVYADPRQRMGKVLEPGVDIYALGIIAYQLLMGDVTREMGPAWRAELDEYGISAGLLDLIAACVDVPSKRTTDAGALLAALDKLDLELIGKKNTRNGPTEFAFNYCIQCGGKIQADDRFCTQCGYRMR